MVWFRCDEVFRVLCVATAMFAGATRVSTQDTVGGHDEISVKKLPAVSRVIPGDSQEPLVETEQQVSWKPASHLVRPMILDPRRTWQSFLRHSERENNRRKKARNRVRSSILQNQLLRGPPGARGPPGVRGPRGPPGANITKEELLQEFRSIVREAAERRIQKITEQICSSNNSFVESEMVDDELLSADNESVPVEEVEGGAVKTENAVVPSHLFEVSQVSVTPCIREGFLWQLSDNFVVEKKSFVEVQNFHVPFAEGSFQRGEAVDASTHRFQIPRMGIYQIQAMLLMERGSTSKSKSLGIRDVVNVMVCIDSLCQNNMVLQNRFSLESQSHHFTVLISGVLHLQKGRYLSVFVDNNTRVNLRVVTGSQFSVVLLGV